LSLEDAFVQLLSMLTSAGGHQLDFLADGVQHSRSSASLGFWWPVGATQAYVSTSVVVDTTCAWSNSGIVSSREVLLAYKVCWCFLAALVVWYSLEDFVSEPKTSCVPIEVATSGAQWYMMLTAGSFVSAAG